MTLVTHIDSNAFDEGSIQQSHAVQRLLEQLRDLHTGQLDQIQSFSWLRFMFSLVSYTLFFTDVLRSGLGYQETPNQVTLEPDHQVVFGPVGYPILHLTTANATPSYAIPYWPYKYDSTSVPLRATAEYLDVSAWTPCMLYKDKCDETSGVSLHSVFDMIDSLVGAVRDHRPPSSRTSFQRQGHVTLRAKSVVYDRLHDLGFSTSQWRVQFMPSHTSTRSKWALNMACATHRILDRTRAQSCGRDSVAAVRLRTGAARKSAQCGVISVDGQQSFNVPILTRQSSTSFSK